jgi:hypothetical protein
LPKTNRAKKIFLFFEELRTLPSVESACAASLAVVRVMRDGFLIDSFFVPSSVSEGKQQTARGTSSLVLHNTLASHLIPFSYYSIYSSIKVISSTKITYSIKMRRVSSRQRLVSWDAFDATTGDGSDLSDSDYSDINLDSNPRPAVRVVAVEECVRIMSKLHSTGVTAGSHHDSVDSCYSETSSVLDSSRHCSATEQTQTAPPTTRTTPQRRKKRGRRKHHGPAVHVIPSYAWEVPNPEAALERLVQDVQLHICSFLDTSSLRSVLCLNRKYRALVLSAEATTDIWMPHFHKRWPMMNNNINTALLGDAYSLPTATGNEANGSLVNLPLLLSMTPEKLPTEVDETLLDDPRNHHHSSTSTRASLLRSRRSARRISQQLIGAPRSTKLEVYQPNNNNAGSSSPLIRYTGPIGSGDRCIRANHPLPRPIRKTCTWRTSMKPKFLLNAHPSPADGVHSALNGSLFDLLCQGARAVSRTGMADWRPFVAPHWQTDGTLDVTPSLVAYYEVDILERPQETSSDDDDDDDSVAAPLPGTRPPSHTSECVAVGIATESFHVHTRMPGWDSRSFGYHGDDGGIFHSSGGMVERFGPTFGVGDTIGCGIDYVAQGIFFTLNGKFLGYGWKNIGVEFLHNDLYPVVGIDTNAPISLNMGTTRPFKYDMSEFHQQHAKLIRPQYQFSTKQRSSSRSTRSVGLSRTSSSGSSSDSSSGSISSRKSSNRSSWHPGKVS